jgi:hypothetical protein
VPRKVWAVGRCSASAGRLPTDHVRGGAKSARNLILAGVLVAAMAGCASHARSSATTQATNDHPSLLQSPAQSPSFADTQHAIDDLYRRHPEIESFSVRDVQYNTITRDKVLETCRHGGAETDPAALESTKIAGCAPLIYFLYNYGKQSSVAESIDVAAKLYWYAVTNIQGPFDPKQSLVGLLRNWGVQ